MDQDAQHLKLLSIFHFVCAGVTGLIGCFPLIHLAMGIAIAASPDPVGHAQHLSPRIIGWMFIAVAALVIAIFWILAIAMATAGFCLGRRKFYTFCLVVAAVECMLMPFGTVLGVFTIIVLMRPSVKLMFNNPATA